MLFFAIIYYTFSDGTGKRAFCQLEEPGFQTLFPD